MLFNPSTSHWRRGVDEVIFDWSSVDQSGEGVCRYVLYNPVEFIFLFRQNLFFGIWKKYRNMREFEGFFVLRFHFCGMWCWAIFLDDLVELGGWFCSSFPKENVCEIKNENGQCMFISSGCLSLVVYFIRLVISYSNAAAAWIYFYVLNRKYISLEDVSMLI